jgi:hypothetical protein
MNRRLYRGRLPRICPHAGDCSTDSSFCGEIGLCSATAWLLAGYKLDQLPTSSKVPA